MERLETENTLKIVFCGKGSCKCPSIDISKSNGVKMFLEEAKKGTFEKYL